MNRIETILVPDNSPPSTASLDSLSSPKKRKSFESLVIEEQKKKKSREKGGEFKCDSPDGCKSYPSKSVLRKHKKKHHPLDASSKSGQGLVLLCNTALSEESKSPQVDIIEQDRNNISAQAETAPPIAASLTTMVIQAQTQKKQKKRAQKDEHKCPFPGCTKSYRRGYTLNRHKMIHTEASFKCNHPKCGRTYNVKDSLTRHRRINHPITVTKTKAMDTNLTSQSEIPVLAPSSAAGTILAPPPAAAIILAPPSAAAAIILAPSSAAMEELAISPASADASSLTAPDTLSSLPDQPIANSSEILVEMKEIPPPVIGSQFQDSSATDAVQAILLIALTMPPLSAEQSKSHIFWITESVRNALLAKFTVSSPHSKQLISQISLIIEVLKPILSFVLAIPSLSSLEKSSQISWMLDVVKNMLALVIPSLRPKPLADNPVFSSGALKATEAAQTMLLMALNMPFLISEQRQLQILWITEWIQNIFLTVFTVPSSDSAQQRTQISLIIKVLTQILSFILALSSLSLTEKTSQITWISAILKNMLSLVDSNSPPKDMASSSQHLSNNQFILFGLPPSLQSEKKVDDKPIQLPKQTLEPADRRPKN